MVRLRILQTEASERDAALILRLLERAEYQFQIESVQNGEPLRAALKAKPWELIICGYQAGLFGALQALDIVRNSGADVPLVIASRTIDDDTAVQLIQSGAHDYVTIDNLSRLIPIIERETRNAAARRRHSEVVAALQESEERLTIALAASKMGVWEWDLNTNALYWSEECYAIMNLAEFDGTLDSFLRIVEPLDHARVWRAIEAAVTRQTTFAVEFRFNRDGQTRWLSNFGKLKCDAAGQPSRLIGTVEDITGRKEAEETMARTIHQLQELTGNYRLLLGQLSSVREEERAHLSRELHDQLGQTLTTLKIKTYLVEQALKKGEIGVALQGVDGSVANIDAVIEMVRGIATELRPPLLDQVGLAAALEWQVDRFARQHGMDMIIDLPPSEPRLTETQKISAFRIAQESLTNIVRHAGTKTVKVSLVEDSNSVRLIIEDIGVGFQPGEVIGSLGIFGMRERARLIDASFSIHSNPDQGTTVELIIPKNAAAGVSSA